MKRIEILGMKFYAHHGWYELERKIGQFFVVDLIFNINTFAQNDQLDDTVDYQKVYELVAYQMNQSCKLLETVLDNIGTLIISEYSSIKTLTIKIYKQPSFGGIVDQVCISGTYEEDTLTM